MPSHDLRHTWPPPSSYSAACSPSPSYPRHHQHSYLLKAASEYQYSRPAHAAADSQATRRRQHHYRFRCLRFRFLSSHGALFRLLGAAVCACSLLHFIVHLFVSDLFDLFSGAVPVPAGRVPEQFRNLTWHVGPDLTEDDRRVIILYTYPYMGTESVNAALRDHPRVVWVPEHLMLKYASNSARQRRAAQNLTAMVTHLFNCSNLALPIVLHVMNGEAVGRGEQKWCLSKTRGSSKTAARCKQSGGSSCAKFAAAKLRHVTACRKVTRRQLRTFCQQHHLAVRLADAWKLRDTSGLLHLAPNLRVVHVIGLPDVHRNTTSRVHFSSRTHKVSRLYHRVVQAPRRRRVCERLADDFRWLGGHDGSLVGAGGGGPTFYQRFPANSFDGADAEGALLELYNFLDIYLSDNIRLRAQALTSASLQVTLAGDVFLDPGGLTEDVTYRGLREIYTKTCSTGGPSNNV